VDWGKAVTIFPPGQDSAGAGRAKDCQKYLRISRASFDKFNMMTAWLTLSNRQENLKPLLEYVRNWARDRGLSPNRRRSLEKVAEEIFRHLVSHAYGPDQPGSIAISLEEKGPRLRLVFEDDAAPHNPSSLSGLPGPGGPDPTGCSFYNGLQPLAESLIYYRTADRKNRLVVFLT
jgi:anti-sigma regulatory factor (Ser/Thr protein kinase)